MSVTLLKGKLVPLTALLALGAIMSYSYALKYVAGYMDMTEWANPHDMTNITVGLIGLLLAFGAVIGLYAPKKLYYKLSPKKRQLATMTTTAILAMVFCYFLGIAGVPGFRLW